MRLPTIFRRSGRPARVYGVGAAKTGTHSIAALFEGSDLIARHEPHAEELIELALSGRRGTDSFSASLRAIIENASVSINISQINGYLIEDLYSIYPDAKYILTVRDAEGWVGSLINHIITRHCQPDGPWDKFRRLRFDRGLPYLPEDAWLRENGIYSLDSLLEYWKEHNISVLSTVPNEHLCIVPTLKIRQYKQEIYQFAGVKRAPRQAVDHVYRGDYVDTSNRFPAGYVQTRCSYYSDCLIRSVRQIVNPMALDVLKEAIYPERSKVRIDRYAAGREAVMRQSTDLARWASVASETDERWDGRAKQAASLLADQEAVIDLGCGAMTLERYLPRGVNYFPHDCIRRDERTIVCDLNREVLPKFDTKCVVALGLLEYINDVPALIHNIAKHADTFICSYIPVEAVASIEARRSTGWVNDFSLAELEEILSVAGYSTLQRHKYLDRTWIWRADCPGDPCGKTGVRREPSFNLFDKYNR